MSVSWSSDSDRAIPSTSHHDIPCICSPSVISVPPPRVPAPHGAPYSPRLNATPRAPRGALPAVRSTHAPKSVNPSKYLSSHESIYLSQKKRSDFAKKSPADILSKKLTHIQIPPFFDPKIQRILFPSKNPSHHPHRHPECQSPFGGRADGGTVRTHGGRRPPPDRQLRGGAPCPSPPPEAGYRSS